MKPPEEGNSPRQVRQFGELVARGEQVLARDRELGWDDDESVAVIDAHQMGVPLHAHVLAEQ
jgi:hypothetical protein